MVIVRKGENEAQQLRQWTQNIPNNKISLRLKLKLITENDLGVSNLACAYSQIPGNNTSRKERPEDEKNFDLIQYPSYTNVTREIGIGKGKYFFDS